jgi:hypothetical protein
MISNGKLHPGIRVDRIEVGGGAIGLIFVASTVYTFAIGIPALRMFLIGAIALGVITSILLALFHRYRPMRVRTSFLP